ncbi:MAG: hypothetical protein ABIA78_01210 [archaeon]
MKSKSEIESELSKKGNFIKVDYLNGLLKEVDTIDMKKFVCLKLAKVYEDMGMFGDAGKAFDSVAKVSIAFSEKIKFHLREVEMYIKAKDFVKVDEAVRKTMSEANLTEKEDIMFSVKSMYRKEAENYEKQMKRNNAVRIYERLIEMKMLETEKNTIREKLIDLYNKLGKFEEARRLKGK